MASELAGVVKYPKLLGFGSWGVPGTTASQRALQPLSFFLSPPSSTTVTLIEFAPSPVAYIHLHYRPLLRAMASKTASADIASRVSKLSLKTSPASAGARSSKVEKTKKAPAVADSWEDEDVSSPSEGSSDKEDHASGHSASDDERDQDRTTSRSSGQAGTAAPPPTPMSPTYGSKHPFPPATSSGDSFDSPYAVDVNRDSALEKKRPEKTDAVARRMIASALGVKVPRMTDEQKKYDQAMREKERRRREEEKALQKKREEEALKAKQAVWED